MFKTEFFIAQGILLNALWWPPILQLTAEQLSTGECRSHQKKDIPRPRAKKKQQKEGRRDKIASRIKPYTHQRQLEGSNKPCVHQDPETPQRPSQNCVGVSPVEVQVSSGLPQGQGLWVQQTWVWHKPSSRRSPLTPPQSCQNLQDWEIDSWRAQTKPCAHQDPGERSSEHTKGWPSLAKCINPWLKIKP